MKYLSLLCLLVLSKFTSGQQVFTKFDKVVLYDDFSFASNRWEQKNSASESFLVSDGNYVIKRLKDNFFAISVPNEKSEYDNFEVVTSIKLDAGKKQRHVTGGLVMKAQKSGDGALILEINTKKEYRVRILQSGNTFTLFGDKNDGWQKSGHLFPYGFNEIKVITSGNEFDLYFNKKFERSIIETTFDAGRIGFFAGPLSSVKVNFVIVRTNGASTPAQNTTEAPSDETYTELALVFKAKIDKQQKEIDELNDALYKCKSSLNLDTTAVAENKTLREQNVLLSEKAQKLEGELERAKERMSYLESMRADIENNTNGDLILNLTDLLAKEKNKNQQLNEEVERLKKELKAKEQRY